MVNNNTTKCFKGYLPTGVEIGVEKVWDGFIELMSEFYRTYNTFYVSSVSIDKLDK